jgi:hypothetical protein
VSVLPYCTLCGHDEHAIGDCLECALTLGNRKTACHRGPVRVVLGAEERVAEPAVQRPGAQPETEHETLEEPMPVVGAVSGAEPRCVGCKMVAGKFPWFDPTCPVHGSWVGVVSGEGPEPPPHRIECPLCGGAGYLVDQTALVEASLREGHRLRAIAPEPPWSADGLEPFRPKNDTAMMLSVAVGALFQSGRNAEHLGSCPVARDVVWITGKVPVAATPPSSDAVPPGTTITLCARGDCRWQVTGMHYPHGLTDFDEPVYAATAPWASSDADLVTAGPCPKCGWVGTMTTGTLNDAAGLLRWHHEWTHGLPPSSDAGSQIDVERLTKALRATGALWSQNDYYEATTDAEKFAVAIAREYVASDADQ